jgi:hypothetical protein
MADYVDPNTVRNPSMPAEQMRERGTFPLEPELLGLGDQPTAPLADDPGPVPNPTDDSQPFHQYLIAVGALGEKPEDIGRILHDVGMEFAHRAGISPLLCVGYVSPVAKQADYLSGAKAWYGMGEGDRAVLHNYFPKLHTALELLFGKKS